MGVRKPKVDWEGLCKKLQEALAKEMKETERLHSEIQKLNENVEYFQEVNDSYNSENMFLDRSVKDSGALIRYLENRLVDVIVENRKLKETDLIF
jgi:hypothetical protein